MKIHNFYFSNTEWWIEYIENNQVIKVSFTTEDELKKFILDNNLPLVYKHCPECLP